LKTCSIWGGGYVLDFSNNTFAEFFRETANIDIYAQKYAFNGDSKAKRLRAFWETEPDALVGKILSELLAVWQYNASRNGSAKNSALYKQAEGIVARLIGKQAKLPGRRGEVYVISVVESR